MKKKTPKNKGVITVTGILYSKIYTKTKYQELLTIAKKYGELRDDVYQEYGALKGLKYLNYPRGLRDLWIKENRGSRYGLQGRAWKSALQDALDSLVKNWAAIKVKLNKEIRTHSNFNESEKHYLNYIFCSYKMIQDLCLHKQIGIPDTINNKASIDKQKCERWLHRKIRKLKGNKPRVHRAGTILLDADMYDLHEDISGKMWLGVMGLKPYSRIRIPLTTDKAHTPIKGNIKIAMKSDRIEVHINVNSEVPALRPNENTVAIDKGLGTLIDTSEGTSFGEGFGKTHHEQNKAITALGRSRRKIKSVYNRHEIKGKKKKSNNILKFNLGSKKYNRLREIQKKEIKTRINTALNNFFRVHSPSKVVCEDLTFVSRSNKRLSASTRHDLNTWEKGYLQERLELKCLQGSALQELVNAAYTSQTCPWCGFVSDKNRTGDVFHCQHCGGEGRSHYVSALNILSRLTDPDIGLYTPYKKVREILMERFDQSVETVQPGLQTPLVVVPFKRVRSPQGPSESELLSNCG